MWNERYATEDYVFGRSPALFLRNHTAWLKPGHRALAVADGEGRNGVFLAENGLDVVSMDSSANAQQKAKALAKERGVEIECELADIAEWQWQENAFDLVAGIFIQFVGPEARAEIFEGMKRTVKPGGIILLHGYTPKQLEYRTGGPPFLENLYTPEILRASFADFKIHELRDYEADLDEGKGHSGRSALIDLVAEKPQNI